MVPTHTHAYTQTNIKKHTRTHRLPEWLWCWSGSTWILLGSLSSHCLVFVFLLVTRDDVIDAQQQDGRLKSTSSASSVVIQLALISSRVYMCIFSTIWCIKQLMRINSLWHVEFRWSNLFKTVEVAFPSVNKLSNCSSAYSYMPACCVDHDVVLFQWPFLIILAHIRFHVLTSTAVL